MSEPAPFLGRLSDRFGRRPVIVVAAFGAAASMTLFGLGGSLWVLLAIAALNVVLGVWRPRLMRRRARAASRDALATPE